MFTKTKFNAKWLQPTKQVIHVVQLLLEGLQPRSHAGYPVCYTHTH